MTPPPVKFNKSRSDRETFRKVYHESLNDVLQFWTPDMQPETGCRKAGWRDFDFISYFHQSEAHCWIVFTAPERTQPVENLCNVGGFSGASPLTMRWLGIYFVMADALKFWGGSFSPLFSSLWSPDIDIIDHNPFTKEDGVDRNFDAVTAMVIIELYPLSLRQFLRFPCSVTAQHASIFIEVPDLAYWPKQWALMRGQLPLSSVVHICGCAAPFIGYNQEHTIDGLHRLTGPSGMKVIDQEHDNHPRIGLWLKQFVSDPVLTFTAIAPGMREWLVSVLQPQDAAPVMERL